MPTQFRFIVTRRPRHARRACSDAVVQAPPLVRLIYEALPTEEADTTDHLYRHVRTISRKGVDIDLTTLAHWVVRAAYKLRPVIDTRWNSSATDIACLLWHPAGDGYPGYNRLILQEKIGRNIRLAYC